MKQSLQLKQSLHLALTPQLQQSIKLLQLSTVELDQEIERYLSENPLLERVEPAGEDESADTPPSSYKASPGPLDNPNDASAPQAEAQENVWSDPPDNGFNDDYSYSSGSRTNRDEDDDSEYSQVPAPEPTLQEHLISQLQLINLTERDRQLAIILVAYLDENGYLNYALEDLYQLISEHMEIELEEIQIVLRHIQNLDPTGVGARSLAECLSLQLALLPPDTPALDYARRIVKHYLDTLGAHDFVKLRRLLSCSEDQLKQAYELIISLDPKPGRHFSTNDIRYIVPDVVVKKIAGKWTAFLNQQAMPRLRINKLYAHLLQSKHNGMGKNLEGQLQEARWLIKNIRQRFDTILRVSQAIVERQRHFFDHGEMAMQPLVLREIAEVVGLHESTVSRVTTGKYMLLPRGVFELKYFFGSGLSTEGGGACSSMAVRALIKQMVEQENIRKPLSDNRISAILGQQGIVVARRTVAKYREAMNIKPANLRKSL